MCTRLRGGIAPLLVVPSPRPARLSVPRYRYRYRHRSGQVREQRAGRAVQELRVLHHPAQHAGKGVCDLCAICVRFVCGLCVVCV